MISKSSIRNVPMQVVPPYTVVPFAISPQTTPAEVEVCENISPITHSHQTGYQHIYPGYAQKNAFKSKMISNTKNFANQQQQIQKYNSYQEYLTTHQASSAQVNFHFQKQQQHATKRLDALTTHAQQNQQPNKLPKEIWPNNQYEQNCLSGNQHFALNQGTVSSDNTSYHNYYHHHHHGFQANPSQGMHKTTNHFGFQGIPPPKFSSSPKNLLNEKQYVQQHSPPIMDKFNQSNSNRKSLFSSGNQHVEKISHDYRKTSKKPTNKLEISTNNQKIYAIPPQQPIIQQLKNDSHLYSPLPITVELYPRHLSTLPISQPHQALPMKAETIPNYHHHQQQHKIPLNVGSYQQKLHDFAMQSKKLQNLQQQQMFPMPWTLQINPPNMNNSFSYPQPILETPTSMLQEHSTLETRQPAGINNLYQQRMPSLYSPHYAAYPSHVPIQPLSPAQILNAQLAYQRNGIRKQMQSNQTRSTKAVHPKKLFRPYVIHENLNGSTKKRKRDEVLQPGNSPKIVAFQKSYHKQTPQTCVTLEPVHQNIDFGEGSKSKAPFITPYSAMHLSKFNEGFYSRVLYQQMQIFQAIRHPILEMDATGVNFPEVTKHASQNMQYTSTLETPKNNAM